MVTSSIPVKQTGRVRNLTGIDCIKILFGLGLNKIFFKNYCFRDLHFQTLELTAVCECDNVNTKTIRVA